MAALRRVKPLFQACKNNLVLARHISRANPLLGQWHEDWEVGKKPVTKEETEAAAKKYGLLPEDFVPSSKKSDLSDYPELPRIGHTSLDPYTDWDDPAMCRNFGEPVHRNWEQMTADRSDPAFEHKHSYKHMVCAFLGAVGGLIFLCLAAEPYRFQHKRLEKQYPWGDGVPGFRGKEHFTRLEHYTFEPAK